MHELSIARNIIKTVSEELSKVDGRRIVKVNLVAGQMRAIIPESLQFCFEFARKESAVCRDAELVLTEIPVKVRCNDCHTERELDEPMFICEHCQSTNLEVLNGDELYIDSIEYDEQ